MGCPECLCEVEERRRQRDRLKYPRRTELANTHTSVNETLLSFTAAGHRLTPGGGRTRTTTLPVWLDPEGGEVCQ